MNQGAKADGAKTVPLAGGPLPALPSGNLFIRVIEFRQPAGTSFPSLKHVPGLIFQAEGSQVLAIQDGPTLTITPTEGFFLGPLAHTHSNRGPAANHWYFMALWPTSARTSPLVSLTAQVVYQTPDFPLTTFPPGPYVETLQLLTLERGGRTVAAKHGGIETLFVLDGSIGIHVAGKSPVRRAAGDGDSESPGAATQVFNEASGRTSFLAFYVTAADQPFETPVDQSP